MPACDGSVPGCDAVMVQLPTPMRVMTAVETPLLRDGLPMEQFPVALKSTSNPLDDVAVTLKGCGPGRATELGKEPRVIVWSFLSTAGTEGWLWRCVGSTTGIGTRVVPMV